MLAAAALLRRPAIGAFGLSTRLATFLGVMAGPTKWYSGMRRDKRQGRKRPQSRMMGPELRARLEAGAAAHRAGWHDAAEAAYLEVLASDARQPDALHLLGVLHHQRGQHRRALRYVRQAVTVAPDRAGYHLNLASILRAIERPAQAMKACRRALALDADDPEGHALLGDLLLEQRHVHSAVSAYCEAIARKPERPDLHHSLATARALAGDDDGALSACEATLRLDPGHRQAHWDAVRHEAKRGNPRRALSRLEKAMNVLGVEAHLEAMRAGLLEQAGDVREAEAIFARLAAGVPSPAERANWLVQAGSCQEQLGDADMAEMRYRQAIMADERCAAAWHGLADIDAVTDADTRSIEALLADARLPDEGRAVLQFAHGRICERRHDANAAFAAYRAGNDLIARRRRFDPRALTRHTDAVIDTFGQADRGAIAAPAGPIFIVGMPRSGTTLVESMLAMHPDVVAGGERLDGPWLTSRMAALAGSGQHFPEGFNDLPEEAFDEIAGAYRERVGEVAAPGRRLTDKLPSNYLRLGAIRRLLPEARFIHCRRDPVDTAFSCYATHFRRGQSFTYRLDWLAHAYREYRRIMSHWARTMPESIVVLDYERLVAHPESELRRVLRQCGLGWDPRCLSFHRRMDAVQSASRWQVRRGLYGSSVGRAEPFRQYLGTLQALREEN